MSFYRKIESANGVIGIWKLEEKTEELLNEIQLSANDIERFNRIKFERRKSEFLAARLLVNQLVGQNAQIEYNENGKPFLTDQAKNISISHSLNFVCVFISDKKIGIDIELSTRLIDRVATRFLHPDEFRFITGLKNPQLATITYWSAKEAVFKCSPVPGISFSNQIRINDFNPEKQSLFTAKHYISEKTLNYRLTFEQIENNVLVYCVEE